MKMNKSGQIAPFMVLIMAVLILAIAATIFIGEAGFNRLRVANVADGALITATSAFARNLNRIRQIQKGSGGLQVTYTGLQTFLQSRLSVCQCTQPSCLSLGGVPPLEPSMGVPMYPVWETIGSPMIQPMFYLSMYNLDKLYKSAVDIADNMPEELRSSLYDSSFGGGLIDEPLPFFEGGDCFDYDHLDEKGEPTPIYCDNGDEVLRDVHGRTVGLDYEAYAKGDSPFAKQSFAERYKDYKRGNKDNWYDNNTLSYSFNKSLELEDTGSSEPGNKQKVKCPGQINKGDPTANCPYESYLKVDLDKVPKRVKVEPLPMVLIYQWQLLIPFPCIISFFPPVVVESCYCQVWPMVIPVPKGWIYDINTGTSYGLTVQKKMSFKLFPLLNQKSPELKQRSKVRIKGSFSSGYDFKLEE